MSRNIDQIIKKTNIKINSGIKKYLNLFFQGIRIIKTFKNFNVYFRNYSHPNKNPKTEEMVLWNGARFKIRTDRANADSKIIYEVWKQNCYKINKKDFSRGIIIDIGAHTGTFSLLCSFIKKDALILSFEPELENFSLLKQNIAINKLEDNIKPFQFCVSSSGGTKLLYESKASGGHTLVPNDYVIKNYIQRSYGVSCVTLEQIFMREQIELCDFLKIDCEGSEYDILLKTPSRIFKKIKKISLEYHDGLTKQSHKEIARLLENEKFKVEIEKRKTLPTIEIGYLYAVNSRFL